MTTGDETGARANDGPPAHGETIDDAGAPIEAATQQIRALEGQHFHLTGDTWSSCTSPHCTNTLHFAPATFDGTQPPYPNAHFLHVDAHANRAFYVRATADADFAFGFSAVYGHYGDDLVLSNEEPNYLELVDITATTLEDIIYSVLDMHRAYAIEDGWQDLRAAHGYLLMTSAQRRAAVGIGPAVPSSGVPAPHIASTPEHPLFIRHANINIYHHFADKGRSTFWFSTCARCAGSGTDLAPHTFDIRHLPNPEKLDIGQGKTATIVWPPWFMRDKDTTSVIINQIKILTKAIDNGEIHIFDSSDDALHDSRRRANRSA